MDEVCSAGKGKVLTYRSAVYHKKAIEFVMRVHIHVCDNTKLATPKHIVVYSLLCVCTQHVVSKEENLYKQT